MSNTLEGLKGSGFIFPEINKDNLLKLYEYCDKCGFIKRKKRNGIVK